MASGEQKSKCEGYDPEKKGALVRGADGQLFIVFEDGKTEVVRKDQVTKINEVLENAENEITARLLPSHASGVHVKFPTIFRLPETTD
jgi:hypothetical protein